MQWQYYKKNHGLQAQPPALLVVWACPLQGHVAFPPEGGLTNRIQFVTGSRLKAACTILAFMTLLPAGHSHTALRYTFLSLFHLYYRQSRSNTLSPRNGGHTGLCTPDACRKASDCFCP